MITFQYYTRNILRMTLCSLSNCFAYFSRNFGWSVIPLVATIVITVMVFKRVSGPIGGAGGAGGVVNTRFNTDATGVFLWKINRKKVLQTNQGSNYIQTSCWNGRNKARSHGVCRFFEKSSQV